MTDPCPSVCSDTDADVSLRRDRDTVSGHTASLLDGAGTVVIGGETFSGDICCSCPRHDQRAH